MTATLVGTVHWVCDNDHHGAGPTLPKTCPLGYCGAPVTAYGPGSRKANDR